MASLLVLGIALVVAQACSSQTSPPSAPGPDAGRTRGAAHFDGRAWSTLPEVPGPLAFVVIAKSEIWLGGASGVFRGTGQVATSQGE